MISHSSEFRPIYRKLFAGVLGASLLLLACGDDDSDNFPSEVALEDVREEVRAIRDATRSTPSNGNFPGGAERVLETRLWYTNTALRKTACRGNRCALIVLAHGFGGRTERFDAIGKRLAAAGYIVAAVTFPLTNQDAPGGFNSGIGDTVEQPRDLSVVIDALVEADRDSADPLYRRIDDRNIAAMGHSLGGATVIAATRSPCCTDPRLRATAYVEPVAQGVVALFGEPYAAAGPPTVTFQGEIDFPISRAATHEFHDSLEAPKMLVDMVGGNHVNMIERFSEEPDPLLLLTAETMIAFFDRYLTDQDDRIDEVIEGLQDLGHTVTYAPGDL